MSERAQLPTGPSGVDAPSACAASSTTTRGRVVQRGEVDGQPGVVHRDERVARADRGRIEIQASWDRCRRSRRSRRRSAHSSRWRRTTAATSGPGRRGRCRPRRARRAARRCRWRRRRRGAAPVCAHSACSKSSIAGPPVSQSLRRTCDDRGDVVVLDELAAIRDHTSQFGGISGRSELVRTNPGTTGNHGERSRGRTRAPLLRDRRGGLEPQPRPRASPAS